MPTSGNRVRATKLLTDGTGDLLPDNEYAPLGGLPLNNRGFGAGSCSYCHDHDGDLDANGDLAPVLIVDNHDTHHHIDLPNNVLHDPAVDPPLPAGSAGEWRKCNMCHDYNDRGGSYHDQSGPAFDLHIRICEECHGVLSHSITSRLIHLRPATSARSSSVARTQGTVTWDAMVVLMTATAGAATASSLTLLRHRLAGR